MPRHVILPKRQAAAQQQRRKICPSLLVQISLVGEGLLATERKGPHRDLKQQAKLPGLGPFNSHLPILLSAASQIRDEILSPTQNLATTATLEKKADLSISMSHTKAVLSPVQLRRLKASHSSLR